MSTAVTDHLRTMFRQADLSDCDIIFFVSDEDSRSSKRMRVDDADPARDAGLSKRHPIGEPLPAHRMITDGGSPLFRAQVTRWTHAQPTGSRLKLQVVLDSEDDLRFALSAVGYMYTAQLDISSARDLLHTRRLAAYLEITGCPEACDAALAARIAPRLSVGQNATSLAGVAEVYAVRELVCESRLGCDAVHRVMHTCRQQLVTCMASAQPDNMTAIGATDASLGELFGWAFGDAPSMLSDSKSRQQIEALSAAGMEALLRSDTFSTDDQGSVLLMLARWLDDHPDTPDNTRERLCKLIRLCHLGDLYLFGVLPRLAWFPISRAEYSFLCQYKHSNEKTRVRLRQMALGTYDTCSPWYTLAARPTRQQGCPRYGTRYGWSISPEAINAAIALDGEVVTMYGSFDSGVTAIVAYGAEWYPYVDLKKGAAAAGVYLAGRVPAALNMTRETGVKYILAVNPGDARLEVHRWDEVGGPTTAWSYRYTSQILKNGVGRGSHDALPLSAGVPAGGDNGAGPDNAPDPLARWAAYLKDGKLTGTLSWGAEEP